MTQSSFYADGEVLDAAVVESNDVLASTTPSQAPSGFYPNGNAYDVLTTDSAVQRAAGTATPNVDGVSAVGTSPRWAHDDHRHPTDTSRAAVTYVDAQVAPKANTSYVDAQDALKANITYVDAQDALKAPLASPALTGTPTAPTATAGANTTQLATTAFVEAARVILAGVDATKAPLASPALTGTPTAPTPTASDNSTKLATTAYVDGPDATLAAGLLLRAPLASPALTGTPTAPTASAGTNTTQLATTAFVEAARVILAAADALKAPLASPALTGTPTAPTASAGTNTTQLATTAFVIANAAPPTSYVDNEILYASKFGFSNVTLTKVMELVLPTIGEWDVSATWGFETGAGCVATEYHCQLSETDVAGGIIAAPNKGGSVGLHVNFVAGQGQIFSAGPRRFVTTVINTKAYMLCYSSFSGGAATQTVWGHVRARKVG